MHDKKEQNGGLGLVNTAIYENENDSTSLNMILPNKSYSNPLSSSSSHFQNALAPGCRLI